MPPMIKIWINRKTRRHYTVHLAEDLVADYRSGCLEVELIASTRQAYGYLMVEGKK
jgi:hypothetical protein